MVNIADCIDAAVQGGELDKQKGEAAKDVHAELMARYASTMPEHTARMLANRDLADATKRAARSRYHAVVNQLQTMRRINGLIGKSNRPDLFVQSLVEFVEGSGFQGESVASLQRAYTSEINAGLNDFLRATGAKITGGSRDKELLNDVVRELHGEATTNQTAKDLAAAVKKQQQRMRTEFNARGGDIGELSDYGVTHTHDPLAMRKAGQKAWRTEIKARLDWSRIVDRNTGQPFAAKGARLSPSSDAAADAMLNDIYANITSMGWDSRYPQMTAQGKALYNQRAEARLLHFKGGSDWLEYNAKFGTGDPFGSIVGGLHGMARDVALMRVLGPNPNAGLEFASQVAKKRAQELREKGARVRNIAGVKRDVEDMTNRAVTRTRAMLAHADGSANTPAEGYEASAAFFGATRQYIVSTKLGSALLSSVTDLATIEMAAQSVGMGGGKILSRHIDLMKSAATRETAAQMGWVADTLATMNAGASRFLGETYAPEVTRRMADMTLRLSGLNHWTDMGRTAFKMEFSGLMASNAGRSLDSIDAPLRQALETRGITAADWDVLRDPASLYSAPNGAKFLSPHWWLEHQTTMPRDQAEGLAMRVLSIMEEQMEFAIPSVNLAGRVAFQGDTRPGTFVGELMRSGVMFKSFAMSLMINQLRRFWAMPSPTQRVIYAAKLLGSLTVMGALAVQLKELAKGRDPRPMDDMKFWAAAQLQGGGLGIFGDFFAASTNRFGGNLPETITGPMFGLGMDVGTMAVSNVARAAEGKDLLLGRDVANFVRYNTPVASSLWYQRRAFDALVADQLQMLLDPEAEASFARAERRIMRDYGTSNWWKHGEALPARGPDLSNIQGGTP